MLRPTDAAELVARGLRYDVVSEGNMIAVVVRGYPVPPGYSPTTTDMLLLLPTGFPDAAPDMFWTSDRLVVNGIAPPATDVVENRVGRSWYRWSRHLNGHWRPGIDDLRSYLQFVETSLRHELKRVA